MNDTMEVQDDITIRTAIRAGEDTGLIGSIGGREATGGTSLGGNAAPSGGLIGSGT